MHGRIIHAIALFTCAWFTFAPSIHNGHLQTDPGDTLLNHYILEHSWKWLSDSQYTFPYWSPPCFYPADQTLAYSENLLGTAPLYWAARPFADELRAFQFWMIAVCGLTYISMSWTLKQFGVVHWLAALGAACFAFGLPRVSQLSHQQMLPAMFSPPAVYWCWSFLKKPDVKALVLTLLLVLWQLAASVYLGWLLILGFAVFVGVTLILDRSIWQPVVCFVRHQLPATVIIVGITAGIAIALLWPYREANRGFHRSYRHEVRTMLPAPASWLSPPPQSLWANLLSPTEGPAAHEHHLFPGAVFIVLTAMTIVIGMVNAVRKQKLNTKTQRHEESTKNSFFFVISSCLRVFVVGLVSPLKGLPFVFLANAAILTLISLRFGKSSAWYLVHEYVPGGQGIRAVTRVFSVVMLFGWIGTLVAVSHWLRDRRYANAIGAVLLMVGLVEQYQPNLPAFDARPFFLATGRLADELRGMPVAYVQLDPATPYWTGQLVAMWAGLKANVPVVNGYSGRTPNGYPDEKVSHDAVALNEWLRGRQVRIIAAPRLTEEK